MVLNKVTSLITVVAIVASTVIYPVTGLDSVLVETTLPFDLGAYDLFNRELEQGNSTCSGTTSQDHERQHRRIAVRIRDPSDQVVAPEFGILCFRARDQSTSAVL